MTLAGRSEFCAMMGPALLQSRQSGCPACPAAVTKRAASAAMIIGLKTRHIVQSRYACWPRPYGKTHERRMNTAVEASFCLCRLGSGGLLGVVDFGAERRQPKTAERDRKLAQEI